MRVVYFSNCILPDNRAHTVHIMHMCQAFSKIGSETYLICRAPDGALSRATEAEIFDQYDISHPFRLRRINARWGKLNAVVFAVKSIRYAVGFRPDLVYGRFVVPCFIASFIYRNVAWESHAPLPFFRSALGRVIARLIIARMQRVVVITNALKEEYVKSLGVSPSKIVVLPDGATPAKSSRVITYPNDAQIQVGYIGQLYPGKGMELIQLLVHMCPWAHFHVIGGQAHDLSAWKSRLDSNQNLTFYGAIPFVETIPHRYSVDVLLAPYQQSVRVDSSREDIGRWMSPLKIFEYMSCGKPIIASDLPVLREVLQDGRNAILCPPDEPDKWADALSALKSNKCLGDRLGASALADFEQHYTWEKRASKILQYMGRSGCS